MIVCPSCPRTWSTDVTLAAHLIDAHDVAPPAAVVRAAVCAREARGIERRVEKRQTAGDVRAAVLPEPIPGKPVPTKEISMPKCTTCGATGHRADNSSIHPADGAQSDRRGKKCGYCRRVWPAHSENCKRKPGATGAAKRTPITRRHPLPQKKADGASGHGLLSELDALRTTAAALEPLEPASRHAVLACVCKLLLIDVAALAA